MWDSHFWTFFAIVVIITSIIAAVKKIRFADVQVMIMVAAFALACDMLFCKQFELYHYVNMAYRGWYSFWVNLFIVPSWGFLFIKFIPKTTRKVIIYFSVLIVISTLFELFVIAPLGITLYHGWNIIVYSTIGYAVLLILIYAYYKMILKQYNENHS